MASNSRLDCNHSVVSHPEWAYNAPAAGSTSLQGCLEHSTVLVVRVKRHKRGEDVRRERLLNRVFVEHSDQTKGLDAELAVDHSDADLEQGVVHVHRCCRVSSPPVPIALLYNLDIGQAAILPHHMHRYLPSFRTCSISAAILSSSAAERSELDISSRAATARSAEPSKKVRGICFIADSLAWARGTVGT